MSYHFSKNLKQIRKDHNLSQEQLAEELGVSRQAISKWESQVAYPEMEKILQLCDKFHLNIDDLLHKDIEEIKEEEISKNNLNKYMDDFLNFITDSIDLFSKMSLKSKIKCLFEEVILIILCCSFFLIMGKLLENVFFSIFNSFHSFHIFDIIGHIFSAVYFAFSITFSLVILVHVFKTRYLNYYIKNRREEQIEKDSIKTTKIELKQEERKIIIRDPKHSEYRFIHGILRFIIGGIKAFTILFSIGLCFTLLFLLIMLVFSFTIMKTGIFFLGFFLSIFSSCIINLLFLLLLLNFVLNRKSDKKKMVRTFFISLVVLGCSFGLLFVGSLSFDVIEKNNSRLLKTDSFELDMSEKLFFQHHDDYEITYQEKNIENIKVEYTINKCCNVEYHANHIDGVYLFGTCSNPFAMARMFLTFLNEKKIINLNNQIYDVKIYASKENIEKLKQNQINFYEQENQRQSIVDQYEKYIREYQEKLEIEQQEKEKLEILLDECQKKSIS